MKIKKLISTIILRANKTYLEKAESRNLLLEEELDLRGYSLPFYTGGPWQYLGSEMLQKNHIWSL